MGIMEPEILNQGGWSKEQGVWEGINNTEKLQKKQNVPGIEAQAFNPSSWEAEAGQSLWVQALSSVVYIASSSSSGITMCDFVSKKTKVKKSYEASCCISKIIGGK